MEKSKRGDDAADHAPHPAGTEEATAAQTSGKQGAPNYRDREDGGRSIPTEDINSANDE